MLEELKQEKFTISEIEDMVNKKIEEFVNDPGQVGSLYEEGKVLMEQTKEQFHDKDIRMYIAKELVSKNAGFELERRIDDARFRKKYDNINYLGIITAMVAYKSAHYPDIEIDKAETMEESGGTDSQLERYKRMDRKELLNLIKVARQSLKTPDKDEREQTLSSIVLMEKALTEKK